VSHSPANLCSFEERFRYDDEGVPRIWRPTDDIDGAFARARDRTLDLIPLLSKFRLSSTSAAPPLDAWIGTKPSATARADEEDLVPIGGIDDDEHSLEDEAIVLSEARQADVAHRFRKMADGVYVEAKRGALGGVTQTPFWVWVMMLLLGQNEIRAVASSPFLVMFVLMVLAAAYVTYQLNLWTPIIRMSTAAWDQGMQVGKEKLREFLANTETGREAIAMEGRSMKVREEIRLDELDNQGRKASGKVQTPWDEE